MASLAERAARLERRLKERQEVIEVVPTPWLAELMKNAQRTPPPPATEAAPTPEPATCRQCEAVLAAQARFCHLCGTPVAGVAR
jgi:hypothetical protein